MTRLGITQIAKFNKKIAKLIGNFCDDQDLIDL